MMKWRTHESRGGGVLVVSPVLVLDDVAGGVDVVIATTVVGCYARQLVFSVSRVTDAALVTWWAGVSS